MLASAPLRIQYKRHALPGIPFIVFSCVLGVSCASIGVTTYSRTGQEQHVTPFVSGDYHHFAGGVLFTDIAFGLDILWSASFRNGWAYKETVGLFVPDGLLILPNNANGVNYGKLDALTKQVTRGKLLVYFQGNWIEVLGIIHTHPRPGECSTPSPGADYQYCYLGLHNYVMDQRHLTDAYKDNFQRERFIVLGQRTDYHLLPFVMARPLMVAR